MAAILSRPQCVNLSQYISANDATKTNRMPGLPSKDELNGCVFKLNWTIKETNLLVTRPCMYESWWRHRMGTFSALLEFCAGNSPVTGESPTQRPVTWSFDVFFDLCLNKWLSKQSWGRWFETPSRSLWRHCHGSWVNLLLQHTHIHI